MQCQGETRNGNKCRNRSLQGELFCEVHLRVNHSRNLTLLLPGLILILAIYFVLTGLFFQVSLYNLFDISFLEFAGVEDIFLGAIKHAAVITLLLAAIWFLYSLILSVFFTILLTVGLFKSEAFSDLSYRQRLKATSIAIYVLLSNMLLRFILITPARGRIKNNKIKVTQKRFSKAFINLHNTDGQLRAGRPFKKAKDIFSRYLFFKEMGNHKFAILSLLLFGLSAGLYVTTYNFTESIKTCTLPDAQLSGSNKGKLLAFEVTKPCKTEIKSIFFNLKENLAALLFPISNVTIEASDVSYQALHLGSTSRHEILYDQKIRKPIILPKNIQFSQAPSPISIFPTDLKKDIQKFAAIATEGFEKFTLYFKQIDTTIKEMKMEISALRKQVNDNRTRPASLPNYVVKTSKQTCLRSPPVHVVNFEFNSSSLPNATALDRLRKFAKQYAQFENMDIVISGYTDPAGSLYVNHHVSKMRADRVMSVLNEAGISKNHLISLGLGISDNSHPQQRRAEIRICWI